MNSMNFVRLVASTIRRKSYKLSIDLSIYRSCELASNFVEISRKTNIVIGCNNKPPDMNFNE